ncbi:MAG: hypothetical protein KDC87_03775 [Planctomycetes bacterium]|nr:hypothetical protein [Planctomycetota bacterium]MCB9869932.1 hypothetical protein [Planctomycetota bacterium]
MHGADSAMPPEPGPSEQDAAPGLLAGIDEAGLGPVLGPLVVAGVALSGPTGGDPWRLLRRKVARTGNDPRKVRVADSKKVHSGPHGFQRLERTVLAFWSAMHGSIPPHLGALLRQCDADLDALRRCPWYEALDLPLPQANDRDQLELFAHLLGREMKQNSVELLHLAIRPMDVAEFNASIATTGNKSDTHFAVYSDVITSILEALPGNAHVVADRCGGRIHYLPALRRRLAPHRIELVAEQARASSYTVHTGAHRVRITFAERGEERSFPTALASCAAKYVRELMMVALNSWFADRLPGLQRTAGYYVDGNRFLQDVAQLIESPGFPVDRLVRCR